MSMFNYAREIQEWFFNMDVDLIQRSEKYTNDGDFPCTNFHDRIFLPDVIDNPFQDGEFESLACKCFQNVSMDLVISKRFANCIPHYFEVELMDFTLGETRTFGEIAYKCQTRGIFFFLSGKSLLKLPASQRTLIFQSPLYCTI